MFSRIKWDVRHGGGSDPRWVPMAFVSKGSKIRTNRWKVLLEENGRTLNGDDGAVVIQ